MYFDSTPSLLQFLSNLSKQMLEQATDFMSVTVGPNKEKM